jgi:hypothetical protein
MSGSLRALEVAVVREVSLAYDAESVIGADWSDSVSSSLAWLGISLAERLLLP